MMALLADIDATLNIEVDKYHKQSPKFNNFVKPGEKIKSISWHKTEGREFGVISTPGVYEINPISEKDLNKVYHLCPTITIKSDKAYLTFTSHGGFTLRQLMDNILAVEKISRPKTDWFGGIDAHHIYFEGLVPVKDEKCTYKVQWGR